jgi:hypothetical protein
MEGIRAKIAHGDVGRDPVVGFPRLSHRRGVEVEIAEALATGSLATVRSYLINRPLFLTDLGREQTDQKGREGGKSCLLALGGKLKPAAALEDGLHALRSSLDFLIERAMFQCRRYH